MTGCTSNPECDGEFRKTLWRNSVVLVSFLFVCLFVSISSRSLLIGGMAAEPLCACRVSFKWPWSTSDVLTGCSWRRWEKRHLYVSLIFFFKCVLTTASLLHHLSKHTQSSEVKLNVRSASKKKKSLPWYKLFWFICPAGGRGVFGFDHSLCCPLLELRRACQTVEGERAFRLVCLHPSSDEGRPERQKKNYKFL